LNSAKNPSNRRRSRIWRRESGIDVEERLVQAQSRALRQKTSSIDRSYTAKKRIGSTAPAEDIEMANLISSTNSALDEVDASTSAIPDPETPSPEEISNAIDTGEAASTAIGIFGDGTAAKATALILSLILCIGVFVANTGNPQPTTTITTATSTSTSTTTSSAACTASAGPLQDWIVMTSFDTSADQFSDILADFKNAGVAITTTVQYDDINWRFFTAPLNQCHVKLLKNPLIIGSLPNTELPLENPASEQDLDLRDLHVNATFEPIEASSISKRDTENYFVQTGIGGVSPFTCPLHLQDLSDPWAKPLTQGSSKFSIWLGHRERLKLDQTTASTAICSLNILRIQQAPSQFILWMMVLILIT
jgi:hypothetical protein